MAILLLSKRLHHDTSSQKHTCPLPLTQPPIHAFIGTTTYHTFATILSGASALTSILIISLLIFQHARHYTHPIQQRQILRITLLVPWVSIFSFLIVWQRDVGEYFGNALDFGCAIALAAFLLLLCDFVLAGEGGYQELFGENEGGESPAWFKVCLL